MEQPHARRRSNTPQALNIARQILPAMDVRSMRRALTDGLRRDAIASIPLLARGPERDKSGGRDPSSRARRHSARRAIPKPSIKQSCRMNRAALKRSDHEIESSLGSVSIEITSCPATPADSSLSMVYKSSLTRLNVIAVLHSTSFGNASMLILLLLQPADISERCDPTLAALVTFTEPMRKRRQVDNRLLLPSIMQPRHRTSYATMCIVASLHRRNPQTLLRRQHGWSISIFHRAP